MNFAQMLGMDVKPLPDTREPKGKDWKRNTRTANIVVRTKAITKYCEAIGHEWIKTVEIAERLNKARTSIFKQLVKYHELGILERRPVSKPYNHHTGWYWRVK